jgi:CheY-like chemotaxis protein
MAPVAQPDPRDLPGSSETILLADDDDALRGVVSRMLERYGFSVLCASSGAEALALFERYADDVDVLVTDVVMPDMDGPDLVTRLAARWMEPPVIFMSGYSDQEMLERVTLSPRVRLLRKPFTFDTLLRAIREILDR